MRLNSESTQAMIGDIKIIDVDTHLSEPHDLWVKRAPKKMRDRVPRVVKLPDGDISWVIDDDISIGRGAAPNCAIRQDGEKPKGMGYSDWKMEDAHRGSYSVNERLEVMDQFQIFAQIVYPNILGFGGQNTAKVDPELRLVSAQLYNDAMAEMQEESGQRIFPMALLPWWDIKAAVAEVERCQAMGLRGININSDPQMHKNADGERLPDLGDPYWDPLWEICEANSVPINFHIGASEQAIDWVGDQGWPSLNREMRATLGGSMLFINNGRTMGNIILSGLLDRYPKLRFVSVESGIGWLPFLLEALDYQFSEFNTGTKLQRKPSEYFQSNFFACFWFERRNLKNLVEILGADKVMFETDFPHPTCLHPNPLDYIAGALETLQPDERRKVLSGNASKLYNIPVN